MVFKPLPAHQLAVTQKDIIVFVEDLRESHSTDAKKQRIYEADTAKGSSRTPEDHCRQETSHDEIRIL